MKKGISPIVSVVLLIAIAVIAAVGIYFWMGGMTTKQPTPNPPVSIVANPVGPGKVLIANLGPKPFNTSSLKASSGSINCPARELAPGEQVLCTVNGSGTIAIWGNGTGSTIVQIPGNETSGGGGTGGGSGGGSGGGAQSYWPVYLSDSLAGYSLTGSELVLVTPGSVNVTVVNATTGDVICSNDISSITKGKETYTLDAMLGDELWEYPSDGNYVYIPVWASEGEIERPAVLKIDKSCNPVDIGINPETAPEIDAMALIGDKLAILYSVKDGQNITTFDVSTMNPIHTQLCDEENPRWLFPKDEKLGIISIPTQSGDIEDVYLDIYNWNDEQGWVLDEGNSTIYSILANGISVSKNLITAGSFTSPPGKLVFDYVSGKLLTVISTNNTGHEFIDIYQDIKDPEYTYLAESIVTPDECHAYLLKMKNNATKAVKEIPILCSGKYVSRWYPLGIAGDKLVYYWEENNEVNVTDIPNDTIHYTGSAPGLEVDNSTVERNGSLYYKINCSNFDLEDSPDPREGHPAGGLTPVNITVLDGPIYAVASFTSYLQGSVNYLGIVAYGNGNKAVDDLKLTSRALDLSMDENWEYNHEEHYDIDQQVPITYTVYPMASYDNGWVIYPKGRASAKLPAPSEQDTGILEKCVAKY